MSLDATLDGIYGQIDFLMTEGRFEEIDGTLSSLKVGDIGIDLCLGYLTATLPAKSKLPSRRDFYSRAKEYALEYGFDEPGLFDGLE